MQDLSICFVALYTYSLFNPTTSYRFGGSEVRSWLFSKGLAKLPGNQVSFIVFDHGQDRVEIYDDVAVYAHSGYPIDHSRIRRLLARIRKKTGIQSRQTLHIGDYDIPQQRYAVYEQVNADIYCVFGVSNLTAEVARYCEHNSKPLVLFSGSDDDFSENYKENSKALNYYQSRADLCYYVIQQADLIFTQTKHQAALLKNRFGRDSVVVRNPIDLSDGLDQRSLSHDRATALWVGKSNHVKHPMALIKLARLRPNVSFTMIMNMSLQDLFDEIMATKPDNVTICERVPLHQIEEYFARAFVLINTSQYEGFPNTFLQAGKYGTPVLSLNVDPDSFIQNYRCGVVANGDWETFVDGLDIIRADWEDRREFSSNILKYTHENHALEGKAKVISENIRTTFGEVISRKA